MKKLIAVLAVAALAGCATSGPTTLETTLQIKVTLLQTPCSFAKDDPDAKEAKVETKGNIELACWIDGSVAGQPNGYLVVFANGRVSMVPKADFK